MSQEVYLNREERRRLKYNRGSKNQKFGSGRFVNQNALLNAEFSAACEGKFTFEFIKCFYAHKRICEGVAEQCDWDLIAVTLSVSNMLAKNIDKLIVKEINAAVDAMANCRDRKAKHGSYGFTGPEMNNVSEVLNICEELVRNSSQHQLNAATDEYKDRLQEHVDEVSNARSKRNK